MNENAFGHANARRIHARGAAVPRWLFTEIVGKVRHPTPSVSPVYPPARQWARPFFGLHGPRRNATGVPEWSRTAWVQPI